MCVCVCMCVRVCVNMQEERVDDDVLYVVTCINVMIDDFNQVSVSYTYVCIHIMFILLID